MDYILFILNGKELKRIVNDEVTIDQVIALKKVLADEYQTSPDEITIDIKETPSFDNCEFFIDGQGRLMFHGVSYNREVGGVRIVIDIFNKNGLNNFLDQFKGDVMKIISFTTVDVPSEKQGFGKRGNSMPDDFGI